MERRERRTNRQERSRNRSPNSDEGGSRKSWNKFSHCDFCDKDGHTGDQCKHPGNPKSKKPSGENRVRDRDMDCDRDHCRNCDNQSKGKDHTSKYTNNSCERTHYHMDEKSDAESYDLSDCLDQRSCTKCRFNLNKQRDDSLDNSHYNPESSNYFNTRKVSSTFFPRTIVNAQYNRSIYKTKIRQNTEINIKNIVSLCNL